MYEKETGKKIWWGYLHSNGELQIKRFWDYTCIEDAKESPYAKEIIMPFYAINSDEAEEKARTFLTPKKVG